MEKATIEDVQTLASEHTQVYFCKRYVPLYLAFDGSFKSATGEVKGNNTQVTGSLLFQWKATLKMAMSKNYGYFQEERHSISRDVSQQHSWAVMLRDPRNSKDRGPTEHAEQQQIQSNYQELSGHLTVISTSELQCFHVQHRTN